MSLKFRRRIRLLPGFTINLSKSGMSATVGIKGLSVNIGENGTYLNTGIPGTGIYDRIRLDNKQIQPTDNNEPPQNYSSSNTEYEIKSYNPELLNSTSMFGLKQSIIDAKKIKEEMKSEYLEAWGNKNTALFYLIISYLLIFGIFIKNIKKSYIDKKNFAEELKNEYENFNLSISYNFDRELLNDYITLRKSFTLLANTQKKWDIISFSYNDRVKQRTQASKSFTRVPVILFEDNLDFIKTDYSALVFKNANGGDLYFYPGFLIIKDDSDFAIIDYKDLNFKLDISSFIETEDIPTDSKQIGETWKYCNKDGTRDKRFNDSYKIPIMQYGSIEFTTESGLMEKYMFSSFENTNIFHTACKIYLKTLISMKWDSTSDDF